MELMKIFVRRELSLLYLILLNLGKFRDPARLDTSARNDWVLQSARLPTLGLLNFPGAAKIPFEKNKA